MDLAKMGEDRAHISLTVGNGDNIIVCHTAHDDGPVFKLYVSKCC